MKNVQYDSSDFDGLLHKMVFNEPIINQYIGSINGKGEIDVSTVPGYKKCVFWV